LILTARLGLPEAVRQAVLDSFERFDGYGVPAGRAGAEVAEASRFTAVEMNMHHYWKFRDGKVCYVRSSEDTAQVAAALAP